MVWSSLVVALLAMAPDQSAIRLAVAPLRGKGGEACAERLSETFSARVRIVPLEASVEGLTNWDELADWIETNGAPEADVVIVGSLNNHSIVLEAYTTHDKKLVGLKSVVTTARCKLSEETEKLLLAWVDSILPEHPVPKEKKKAAPRETQEKQGAKAATVEEKVELSSVERAPFTVAIRASIAIGRRGLEFTGVTTPNLRAYEVDVMPVPALALEAYLLAGTDVWEFLKPLGLAATFARSVGLRSARVEGGPELDTAFTEVSAHLLYRWRVPLSSLKFDLIPQIGYHHLSFGLRSAAGASEPDLPDVAYGSMSFGVAADVPVLDRVNLFGSGAYLAVLDGGQIFDAGFFEDGSARGYRLDLGMGYEAIDGFFIEVAGYHIAYSLSLNPRPGAARSADAAADTISGIGLGIRVAL